MKSDVIFMKELDKMFQKTIAATLAAVFLTLPLANLAAADERHAPPPPPKHEDRYDRDKDKHHNPPPPPKPKEKEDKDKDDNGNAVTGFIIGAAVGAIVAKNT